MAIIFPNIYYRYEKWDRLRVLGYMDRRKAPAEAVLTFVPLSQRGPAYGPDEPEYDDYLAQFIGDHNTISGLCNLQNPWFICTFSQVPPQALGKRIKYLLRCSGDGYPGLLVDAQKSPDLYIASKDEIRSFFDTTEENYYRFPVLEIQAYDNQIVIIGESVGNPLYWPAGYKVWQEKILDITVRAMGCSTLWEGDDIIVPPDISDIELGRLSQRVWLARMETSYPPPPELEEFWQQIKD